MKLAILVSILALAPAHALFAEPASGLRQLDFMIGRWTGTSRGEPGEGTVERECRRLLNDRFLECRSTVTYPPQEKNVKGEVHVELSLYSFDRKSGEIRVRQFHGEGFVNTYEEGEPLTFTTVQIENIPPGYRARETIRPRDPDSFEETFELAEPGKEFAVYSASTLRRVN